MTTTPTTRPRSGPRSRPCANSSPTRLIAVFQPHLYSRTKALAEEFGAALALADEVVVLDVYPAREEPVGELAGVSGLRRRPGRGRRGRGQARSGGCPSAEPAERALADRLDRDLARSAAARSWSRSAPATSSGSARRWSEEAAMSAAARRGRARTTRWPG